MSDGVGSVVGFRSESGVLGCQAWALRVLVLAICVVSRFRAPVLTRIVDEIEALSSIYEKEWKTEDEANRSYSIKVGEGEQYVILYTKLPEDYPSQSPPVFQLSAPSLSNQSKMHINAALQAVYLENIGECVIFQWIEKIRELLQEQLFAKDQVEENEEVVEDLSVKLDSVSIDTDELPEIIHGEIITDRRSVFQGHVARVFSTRQVKQVLDKLYEEKTIEKATHNIYAYRILKEDTKSFIHDSEDDGETQAGARVMHLLEVTNLVGVSSSFMTLVDNINNSSHDCLYSQILNVQNVLVVVTRWYGGTHLGPDRFRHINNSARQVLDKAGFIPVPGQQQIKKKK
uniref:RWD domain-containing protein n=1 Tax=Timema genevievae TaxID=629358 RepID=A0A7R9PHU7_TIMGE|nr:unnamed protein product [Timema genevievae]